MFGTRLSRLGSVSRLGLVPKAIAILRSYGADAHVYLPGVGTVNGITGETISTQQALRLQRWITLWACH